MVAQGAPETVSGLVHGSEVTGTAEAAVAGANGDLAKCLFELTNKIEFVIKAIDEVAKVRCPNRINLQY